MSESSTTRAVRLIIENNKQLLEAILRPCAPLLSQPPGSPGRVGAVQGEIDRQMNTAILRVQNRFNIQKSGFDALVDAMMHGALRDCDSRSIAETLVRQYDEDGFYQSFVKFCS